MTFALNLLPAFAVALFGGLGAYFVHSRWRVEQRVPARHRQIEHLVLGLSLLLTLPLTAQPLLGGAAMVFGAREALFMLAWLSVVIYWTGSFLVDLEGLQPILLPLAAGLMLAALPIPTGPSLQVHSPLFTLHFCLSMLAYGLLLITTGFAVLLRLADRHLHQRLNLDRWQRFPPLLSLERMMFHTLTLGFALLSFALMSGMAVSGQTTGKTLLVNHKTILSLMAWLVYGSVLGGHFWHGWRGKRVANWLLGGFALLVLGYIGSSFVMEVILHR